MRRFDTTDVMRVVYCARVAQREEVADVLAQQGIHIGRSFPLCTEDLFAHEGDIDSGEGNTSTTMSPAWETSVGAWTTALSAIRPHVAHDRATIIAYLRGLQAARAGRTLLQDKGSGAGTPAGKLTTLHNVNEVARAIAEAGDPRLASMIAPYV